MLTSRIAHQKTTSESQVQIWGSPQLSTQKIYESFLNSGADFLKSLKGSWSLALTLPNEVVLAADQWGTRPLYYTVFNNNLFFADSVDLLLTSGASSSLSLSSLARFLLEDFSEHQLTCFDQIHCVAPGSIVRFKDGQIEVQKWAPTWKNWQTVSRSTPQTVSQWGCLLQDNLATILPRHQKWGFFVSGGLDSSGLVALSCHLIKKHSWPIQIELYHVKTNHSESDDLGITQKLSDIYNLPLTCKLVTPNRLAEEYEVWRQQKTTVPFFPTLQMFQPLMQEASQNGCTGFIFGYGADEQWTIPKEVLLMDLLQKEGWTRFFKEFMGGNESWRLAKSIFKIFLRQQTPLFVKKFFQSILKQNLPKHLRANDLFAKELHSLRKKLLCFEKNFTSSTQKQLFLRNFVSGNNSHNLACHQSLAQQYGAQVYFPYLAPELLNFSLQTESADFIWASDKNVLRETLKGFLTDEIRLAPKFQDYCQLAHQTALLIDLEDSNYFIELGWLRWPLKKIQQSFDDDAFFEVLFARKMFEHFQKTKDDL